MPLRLLAFLLPPSSALSSPEREIRIARVVPTAAIPEDERDDQGGGGAPVFLPPRFMPSGRRRRITGSARPGIGVPQERQCDAAGATGARQRGHSPYVCTRGA
ncbi:MAG: hypothetical protein IPG04_15510 [Polyangiaceae bacterium]|nr:hypothetical protein [Polyangiaceae bacterium]